MQWLLWLYGWPHEALHVIALWLLGKQPRHVTRTGVDLPPGLSRGQFTFVALMPGFIFLVLAAVGLNSLLNATTPAGWIIGILVTLVGMVGVAGAVGDIMAVQRRWNQPDDPPPSL